MHFIFHSVSNLLSINIVPYIEKFLNFAIFADLLQPWNFNYVKNACSTKGTHPRKFCASKVSQYTVIYKSVALPLFPKDCSSQALIKTTTAFFGITYSKYAQYNYFIHGYNY